MTTHAADAPLLFPPETVVEVKAVACELPTRQDVPLSRFSVRELGIITQSEGIDLFTDLFNATNSVEQSLASLPMAAKYRFSMMATMGDEYNPKQIADQVQTAFKFLELTGKVDQGQKVMVVTHGGVLDMVWRTARGTGLDGPRQSDIPNAGLNRVRVDGDVVEVIPTISGG